MKSLLTSGREYPKQYNALISQAIMRATNESITWMSTRQSTVKDKTDLVA